MTTTRPTGLDMDALLLDSWLLVASLQHQPTFIEGQGLALWQRCVADVERVQHALRDGGVAEQSRQDILLAQCALLDEAVKGRGVQDDACLQWYQLPLQGHFLQALEGGETLCERMRQRLAQPAADGLVLLCFHRVMLLGFLGGYASAQVAERQQLVTALSERVAPFMPAHTPWLEGKTVVSGRFQRWPLRAGLSLLLLAGLWWGLHGWLLWQFATYLPGGKQ